jgi:hypothetical protein
MMVIRNDPPGQTIEFRGSASVGSAHHGGRDVDDHRHRADRAMKLITPNKFGMENAGPR